MIIDILLSLIIISRSILTQSIALYEIVIRPFEDFRYIAVLGEVHSGSGVGNVAGCQLGEVGGPHRADGAKGEFVFSGEFEFACGAEDGC